MVNWTGDKDAQLLLGIFEYQNISFNKDLLQHLANKIGEGCTPKAVQHRLVNIKARARKANGGDDNTSSTPGTPASSIGTPRKRSPNKKTTTPKSKRTDNYGNLQSYDELVSTPSAGKGKKRGRLLDNDAANEEDQVDTKRVKTEYKGDFDGLDGDRYGKLGNIFDGPQNARTLEENDEDNLI